MPFRGYPAGSPTTRSNDEVQSASPEDFRKTITGVWRECCRVLRADGLMAFTFHQARLSGWVALMLALAEAGFVVSAVQPVKAEMSTSVAKNALEPSNLDSIIVCRKRGAAHGVADAHRAAELGARRLASLRSAGIEVGPADVRSVIRGHVLATYTASPEAADIDALAALADRLAARYIVGRHVRESGEAL